MTREFVNRLEGEKSPYLERSANSLVQWWPWGEEAFLEAKKRSCPIFLSIGYSTCHFCRLMESESFNHEKIAQILNDFFVSIKVDKEELPHISALYMDFGAALMSSSGGFPLNIFLTPDLKPFFATCYVPETSKMGMMGFREILEHICGVWGGVDADLLLEQADKVVSVFEEHETSIGLVLPESSDYEDGISQMFEIADPVFGGIGSDLKFPMTYQLMAIMAFAWAKEDIRGLYFVDLTLRSMAEGAIHDHLGGGFFRYATNGRWNAPHFEKVLSDNALLASTYLDAWHYLKKEEFRDVAISTLDYLVQSFVSSNGAFFSAEGSEGGGEEGRFYTWTGHEIKGALGEVLGVFAIEHFHVEGDQERCCLFGKNEKSAKLEGVKNGLLAVRDKRERPFRDEKILVSSNALAIEAFAKAGFLLNREDYTKIAVDAAEFVLREMRIDGHFYRRYRDGEVKIEATLEDYAFYIRALLSLFEYDLGSHYLELAIELSDEVERLLKSDDGAFYQSIEGKVPFYQKCPLSDSSEPSGNAVHAENLTRMYQLTFEEGYYQQAEDIFKAAKDRISTHAINSGYMLKALGHLLDNRGGVICIALNKRGDLRGEIEGLLRSYYLPHYSVMWLKGDISQKRELESMMPIDDQTTVYICKHRRCNKPYVGLDEIEKIFAAM